jgi:hypothetical protein
MDGGMGSHMTHGVPPLHCVNVHWRAARTHVRLLLEIRGFLMLLSKSVGYCWLLLSTCIPLKIAETNAVGVLPQSLLCHCPPPPNFPHSWPSSQ